MVINSSAVRVPWCSLELRAHKHQHSSSTGPDACPDRLHSCSTQSLPLPQTTSLLLPFPLGFPLFSKLLQHLPFYSYAVNQGSAIKTCARKAPASITICISAYTQKLPSFINSNSRKVGRGP